MNIVANDPRNFFEQLRRDVDTLFGQQMGQAKDDTSQVVTARWAPAVDIKEDEEKFTLLADLPGIDPKNIQITMENQVLSIQGERRHEAQENRQGFQRVERSYGVFHRRFALPDTADAEHIRAEGRNGVLVITIPKQPKAQPRRINVEG